MIVTTFVHAACMVLALKLLRALHARTMLGNALTRPIPIAVLVLVMFAASLIEAGLWAFTYHRFGPIEDFGAALYFSMVTYTTLGYGDVTLEGGWGLLASFEAVNGLIMFGWTTALIYAAVHWIYFERHEGSGSA